MNTNKNSTSKKSNPKSSKQAKKVSNQSKPKPTPRAVGPRSSPIGGHKGPSPSGNAKLASRGVTKGPRGVGLSSCAILYAKALTNPFGSFEELPCVPSSPPVMTQKWSSIIRGTFTTGTGASGFVLIAPRNAANDVNTVWTTGAAYAGTVFSIAAAGVFPAQRSQSPYGNPALTSGLASRLVGLGLRVRNITQALNVGGILGAIQVSDDETLPSYSNALIFSDPRTVVVPQALSEQTNWSVMNWRPMDQTDLDWIDNEDDTTKNNATLGFMCNAPSAAAAQLFEYEMVEFWEYMGESSAGQKPPELTMSHSDIVGLDRVLSASADPPRSLNQIDWNEGMAQGIVDAMAHSDSAAKTVEDLLGLSGIPLGTITSLVKSVVGFLAM